MKSNEHSILRILRQRQIVILYIQKDLYTPGKDTAAGWQTKKQPMLFYVKLFFWSLFSFWEKKQHACVSGYFHLISLIFCHAQKEGETGSLQVWGTTLFPVMKRVDVVWRCSIPFVF